MPDLVAPGAPPLSAEERYRALQLIRDADSSLADRIASVLLASEQGDPIVALLRQLVEAQPRAIRDAGKAQADATQALAGAVADNGRRLNWAMVVVVIGMALNASLVGTSMVLDAGAYRIHTTGGGATLPDLELRSPEIDAPIPQPPTPPLKDAADDDVAEVPDSPPPPPFAL